MAVQRVEAFRRYFGPMYEEMGGSDSVQNKLSGTPPKIRRSCTARKGVPARSTRDDIRLQATLESVRSSPMRPQQSPERYLSA